VVFQELNDHTDETGVDEKGDELFEGHRESLKQERGQGQTLVDL
jgi:hypothetical protein